MSVKDQNRFAAIESKLGAIEERLTHLESELEIVRQLAEGKDPIDPRDLKIPPFPKSLMDIGIRPPEEGKT